MDPSMEDPMSDEEGDGEDIPASGVSGGSEHDVLEGDEMAEEDVYEYGDPDDPLDRVLDVYLADELEDNLHDAMYIMKGLQFTAAADCAGCGSCRCDGAPLLKVCNVNLKMVCVEHTLSECSSFPELRYLLQYPMRPADRALNAPYAAKVKVANHLLEVEHAIKQGGRHFDSNAPPQLRQPTQKHTGSRVRPATNFAFGVVRNNEFHLTPVQATMQMRPLFDHIDEAKALEIEMDLDDINNGAAKEAERPQQVSFKKKESEKATAARKSTYAYKKSVEDAEPWLPLEIYGQNDQPSLDEFSRMFFGQEGQVGHGSKQGGRATAKEFPAAERYLRGLDYIEEYDENGESHSVNVRGRSQNNAIDLVNPGTSTYSPVNIPATPVQQLGGDAKIVGYLKLAHLVSFSMLLNVTNVSAAAALGALSADGRRGGLLVRGNWAARAEDVWRGEASQAIDCLSVAQCLLHRYGAVSRPNLQRRFPDLDPVLVKKLLSNIAELDSIGRRWVPKLKDGIGFGLHYRSIVDLEEDRWALQAASLRERLGEEILAPPTCQAFEPFTEVLDAVSGELVSVGSYPFPHPDDAFDAYPPSPPPLSSFRSGSGQAGGDAHDTVAGEDVDEEESKPMLYPTDGVPGEGVEESKGKEKEDPDVALAASPGAAAAAATNPPAPSFARALSPKPPPARRQFRPKKKASLRTARVEGVVQDASNIKQEHESSGHDVSKGDRNGVGDTMLLPPKPVMTTTSAKSSALGTRSSGADVPTTEGDDLAGEQGSITSATSAGFSFDGQRVGPDDAGCIEAALTVEEGEDGIGAYDDSNGGNESGFPRGSSEAGAVGGEDKCSKGNGASYGLAAAKEEPREGSSISPGEGAPPAAAATATGGAGAEDVARAGGARARRWRNR